MRFGVEDPSVQRYDLLVGEEKVQVFEARSGYEQNNLASQYINTHVSAMKKLVKIWDRELEQVMYVHNAHLGISSFIGAGDFSTARRLAYPLGVLVSRSMASNTAHPRSRHFSSPVIRQRR